MSKEVKAFENFLVRGTWEGKEGGPLDPGMWKNAKKKKKFLLQDGSSGKGLESMCPDLYQKQTNKIELISALLKTALTICHPYLLYFENCTCGLSTRFSRSAGMRVPRASFSCVPHHLLGMSWWLPAHQTGLLWESFQY